MNGETNVNGSIRKTEEKCIKQGNKATAIVQTFSKH